MYIMYMLAANHSNVISTYRVLCIDRKSHTQQGYVHIDMDVWQHKTDHHENTLNICIAYIICNKYTDKSKILAISHKCKQHYSILLYFCCLRYY